MTPAQSFKFGFLARCVDEGLTGPATIERADQALAFVEKASIFSGIGSVAAKLIEPAVLLGIGVPIAGGAALGAGAAKATEREGDVGEAKIDELIAEYQRLTEQSKRHALMNRALRI